MSSKYNVSVVSRVCVEVGFVSFISRVREDFKFCIIVVDKSGLPCVERNTQCPRVGELLWNLVLLSDTQWELVMVWSQSLLGSYSKLVSLWFFTTMYICSLYIIE